MIDPPELSYEQRMENLKKGTEARKARAELREKVKSGELKITDVLAMSDDPVVAKMKVSALIEALPGYGKAKAAKLMEEIQISESRRVKGLGSRQREELLERLGAK